MSLTVQIAESVALIRSRWSGAPKVGIILGSGLGSLADEIAERVAIPYAEIPHFAQSTAIGHAGRLCCGKLAGHEVVAMQGRFHLYEGHPPQRAAYPIYVMQKLGVETLIVSNAAGGVNPHYAVGDLMAIDDHVNMMFQNPLVGVNDEALGPRFPDMSAPYDRQLLATAEVVARQAGFRLHRGVYVGMLGPTYETRGEYRLVRRLGDAAGMSTVPEVIAARHCGLRVLGVSTITNVCSPDQLGETSGEAVVHAADAAAGKLLTLVKGVLGTI
jgi:purine-nucleoside phosphorylase